MEMTREEVEALPAGREMDARIARLFFQFQEAINPDAAVVPQLPAYSTDIAAAWEVVGQLGDFELADEGGQYCVACISSGGAMWAVGETAPLAICRLALRTHPIPGA